MVEKIELLRNDECNWWLKAKDILQELLQQHGITTPLQIVCIRSDEEAAQYRFFGSPQININGKDIDPNAELFTNFHVSGCRLYNFDNRIFDYPPRELIKEALFRHQQT
jgi:hypothetical protein